jgi:superoxide reductase
MTEKSQVYRCNICGNIIEIIHPGGGHPVCCGQSMELLEEKEKDEGEEKHVPVIKKVHGGVKIKVGSVEHPMERDHYIEWIEIIEDGNTCKEFLKPGDKPEVEFATPKEVKARVYCNVHGLWKSK